jgi:hypothetical protein
MTTTYRPVWRRRRPMALVVIAICVLLPLVGLSPIVHADAGSPTVWGPITGGNGGPVFLSHTTFDLASVGYSQIEFFVEGTASAYSPMAPLTSDGRWTVTSSSHADYRTRIVVNRPSNRRDFNGTVVVEWLNVTGGGDAAPDWIHMHNELIREGYAWVGVSTQTVGLNALKAPQIGDPARYASLAHPGDSYSYDMFSQAGQAIRDQGATILGGLRPRRLIAAGHSQSAGRLVTYIDAVQPLANVYDGFLVHGRNAAGANLSQAPSPTVTTPVPTLIRDDLDVPVLVVNTETDAGALQARQADSPTYRLWEVPGTAHLDHYFHTLGRTDSGDRQSVADGFESMLNPTNQPSPTLTCDLPVNTGPQTFVPRAGVAALNRWVTHGTPPPTAPRLETISIQPLQYALDAHGNVRGGIRTPAVDAPVAQLSGLGQTGAAPLCQLLGTTKPLTNEQLTATYRNHGQFVLAWSHATLHALKSGFLRPADAFNLLIVAAQSDIPA